MIRVMSMRAVGAAALLAILAGSAQAQSANGTVAAPATATAQAAGDIAPPPGPYLSKLPTATGNKLDNVASVAAASVPTGAPGVSSVPAGVSQPAAYGTATAPYTTARVAVGKLGNSSTKENTPVTSYPYRATGKLYFKIGTGTYVCTASLIKKGVLVTAAHCVFDYGRTTAGWYNSFVWCPSNTSSSGGVYGCYAATTPRVLTPYYNGTDVCTVSGVVCNNDVATLLVTPKSGTYAGTTVGYYNYGWNGYSSVRSTVLGNVTASQITQLGYPVALDSGYQMERTDAVGWYYATGNLKNTQIGSAQTGGSSGGPWLVNFGTPPVYGSGGSAGSAATQAIIGVTSWGYTSTAVKLQGASYFGQNSVYTAADYGGYGAGNIGALVRATCLGAPAYCAP